MFGLTEWKQTRFYKEVKAEGRQEGRREGRREGRQEGRQEGRREAIALMKASGLSVEQIATIMKLDLETVRQWLENGS